MINLCELLQIKKEEFSDYKVHFATGSTDKNSPLNAFLIDDFQNWQERQTNRNFTRKYILSLIYYDRDIWMFGGIYKVLSQNPAQIKLGNGKNRYKYQTELVQKATEYIGRAFFKFKKNFRASYPMLELSPQNSVPITEMPLSHILDKRITLRDFSGFDSVNIDYKTLKYIVSDNILSWKSALSNVKGIYLIVDTNTGKQYVGSASGKECIWQRWANYAKDGHGGNVELKKLLKTNGDNYRYNFKYSILEVCNMNLGDQYIISRENHWKEVLLTRQFGLNSN